MTELRRLLHKALILPHLLSHLKAGQSCHLVGGALRDFLLDRPITDFDFVTKFDPTNLARSFASTIGGTWFSLDTQRQQSRVIVKKEGFSYSYDFAPLRDSTLELDLSLRDFTVNAIAVDLAGALSLTDLFDPLGGRLDLKNSLLRACGREVFEDDPLRILRGVRLARVLRLELEPQTLHQMRASSSGLNRSAPERISNELALILAADDGSLSLPLMEDLGLFPILFGETVRPAVIADGIRHVQELSQRFSLLEKKGWSLHDEPVIGGFDSIAILRLGAFLAGSGLLNNQPGLLKKLRLSRRLESVLKNLASLHSGHIKELEILQTSARGRALWVEQLGQCPMLGLFYLASLKEASATFLDKVRVAMADYHQHVHNGRVPDLLNGSYLRSHLGITEGILVGQVLDTLRREEMEGRVCTIQEALKYIESFSEKIIDKPGDPS